MFQRVIAGVVELKFLVGPSDIIAFAVAIACIWILIRVTKYRTK